MEIPDRWLNYTAIGKKIEGTRFIAFKVPLHEQIMNRVDDANKQLDAQKLLRIIPNLGMVVDLTNTEKYYNPDEIFNLDQIQYVKIKIPGHHLPALEYREKFNDSVGNFLKNNQENDKLIGVHCTHGVNRTGFLICNYMVNSMKIDPLEALKRFEVARGHEIERTNYKNFIINGDVGEDLERNDFVKDRYARKDVILNDYQRDDLSTSPRFKNDRRDYERSDRRTQSYRREYEHNEPNFERNNGPTNWREMPRIDSNFEQTRFRNDPRNFERSDQRPQSYRREYEHIEPNFERNNGQTNWREMPRIDSNFEQTRFQNDRRNFERSDQRTPSYRRDYQHNEPNFERNNSETNWRENPRINSNVQPARSPNNGSAFRQSDQSSQNYRREYERNNSLNKRKFDHNDSSPENPNKTSTSSKYSHKIVRHNEPR